MERLIDVARVSQGLARSGRGAGNQTGNWKLRVVESANVAHDGWLCLEGLPEIEVAQNTRTERHLLRPFDVLVTARSLHAHVALVPPIVSRTVASITLLVVRPNRPEAGMGHYLYYYLSSTFGRRQIARHLTVGTRFPLISARSLGEIQVPLPSARELDLIAQLVEASEAAHTSAITAARLRRESLRDSIIHTIGAKTASISP